MYRLNYDNLILVIFLNTFISYIHANWWRLGIENLSNYQNSSRANESEKCIHFTYLNEKQKLICNQNSEILHVLIEGTKMSIDECQFQFNNRRWNCTMHLENQRNIFGNHFDLYNTKELAYLHAISTAGVVYALTKACSKGDLAVCSCTSKRTRTSSDWKWGDCSDDVVYGEKFTKEFIDSVEDSKLNVGIVNLHNNEAGRRLLRLNIEKVCKCHGVSGSCNMKVCWKRLPTFRRFGELLLNKYEGATQVNVLERKRNKSKRIKTIIPDLKKPTKTDLVFLDASADFCQENINYSIMGTKGRSCNPTSYGIDGCGILCCGRGYQTRISDVEEKCNCRFVWCCDVKCDICRYRKEEYICN